VDIEMPVAWDASKYNMKHKRRGRAVIFNHDTFDTDDYAPREGSKYDIKNLHETFTSLLFEVTIHDNLEYSGIKEVISACRYSIATDNEGGGEHIQNLGGDMDLGKW
jgi:caspase-like apoptosis-related cysteine protease